MRQQKYGRLIQKELSDIFLKDKKGFLGNAFITIAEVRLSPDLSIAKVYLSLTLAKDKEGVLKNIKHHKSEIRKELGNRIRNQARIIPDLLFFIDELEETAKRMDDLINNLNIPKDKDEE